MLPLSNRIEAVLLFDRILRIRLDQIVTHESRALLQLPWHVLPLGKVIEGSATLVKDLTVSNSRDLISGFQIERLIRR